MDGTFATHLASVDAALFVGRTAELEIARDFLSETSARRLLWVCGEGGIGKSALLREVGRLAATQGYTVHRIDGRLVGNDASLFAAAITTVWNEPTPLIVIDGYDHMRPLGPHLRTNVLPLLPAGARVLIARRSPTETGWSQDGWDAVSAKVSLRPLGGHDARELLKRLRVDDEQAADNLVRWAAGLPLALTAGAELELTLDNGPQERTTFETWVGPALLHQVVDDEVGELNREVLLLAAIAPIVDAPLIRELLGVDPAPVMAWLRGLSFVEVIGLRVALHDRLRKAMHDELRRTDAPHERELRRRLADHLYERAMAGEPHLLIELRLLITDDAAVRWGLGEELGPLLRTDHARPGDAEHFATALGLQDDPGWERVRRWFDEAPDHVVVIRDAEGAAVGSGIWTTPATSPPWAADDPLAGPWLAHAAEHAPDGNVVMLLDVFDLLPSTGAVSPVVSLGNAAVVMRCGLANPRWIYATARMDDAQTLAFVGALGFRRVPELDFDDGRRALAAITRDHGVGGVIAGTRDLVYRDLGLDPPAAFDPRDAVRRALRDFHDSVALSANPLAQGTGTTQRADHVRARVIAALDVAFGARPDDQLTRAVIERGYFDADGGHDRAQRELFMSRTTYFRRASTGVDRIAVALNSLADSRST